MVSGYRVNTGDSSYQVHLSDVLQREVAGLRSSCMFVSRGMLKKEETRFD